MQPRQDLADGGHRVHPRLDLLADEMGYDLGVGLAGEGAAARDQFVAQRLEVLDDAVVDDRDFAGRMRVRVVGGRAAMCRPARVRDAGLAGQRMRGEFIRQVDELTRCPPPLDRAVEIGGDARRIIAAIFEPLQPVEQPLGDVGRAENAYDTTHNFCPFVQSTERSCSPRSMTTWVW